MLGVLVLLRQVGVVVEALRRTASAAASASLLFGVVGAVVAVVGVGGVRAGGARLGLDALASESVAGWLALPFVFFACFRVALLLVFAGWC